MPYRASFGMVSSSPSKSDSERVFLSDVSWRSVAIFDVTAFDDSSLFPILSSSSSSSSCRLKDNIFEEVDAAGAFQSLFIHRTCSSFSTSAIAA